MARSPRAFPAAASAHGFLVFTNGRQARLHTMDRDFRGIADVEWVESIP